MATGKELVRLTECGYWRRIISKDVDYFEFYNSKNKLITRDGCNIEVFCSVRIVLKKNLTKKYAYLLGSFCQCIASTLSEHMMLEIKKDKLGYIIIIN